MEISESGIVVGRRYRNYRGMKYEVVGFAWAYNEMVFLRDKKDERMVLYRREVGSPLWVCPERYWFEQVDKETGMNRHDYEINKHIFKDPKPIFVSRFEEVRDAEDVENEI